MKIYIDILLVTNAIMTLIMLEAAGRICHKVISPLRLLTACSVGGLSSLVMAIDSRGYFTAVLIVVIKLVSVVFTVLIAFGVKTLGNYFDTLSYTVQWTQFSRV